MPEPDDHTVVLIGNLTDNDPCDLEFWVRDDDNARGSHAHWHRSGLGADDPRASRMSWDRLQEHALDRPCGNTLTVLGSAAL